MIDPDRLDASIGKLFGRPSTARPRQRSRHELADGTTLVVTGAQWRCPGGGGHRLSQTVGTCPLHGDADGDVRVIRRAEP